MAREPRDQRSPSTPDPETPGARSAQTPGIGRQLAQLATWKKAVLGDSVALMAAGVVLPFVVGAPEPRQTQVEQAETPGGATPPGVAPQGLAPVEPGQTPPETGTSTDQAAEPGPGSTLSPALFRLGFSFFVGFAIAFALRSFIKATLIVSGIFLLFLFGMEYAGLVSVQWGAIESRYDSFSAWLESELGSFRTFITGRVPAIGAGLAGLGIGFTRK